MPYRIMWLQLVQNIAVTVNFGTEYKTDPNNNSEKNVLATSIFLVRILANNDV